MGVTKGRTGQSRPTFAARLSSTLRGADAVLGWMAKAAILGCGYTGRVLARRLVGAGHTVVGTTTRPEGRQAIEKTGAVASVARLDDPSSLAAVLDGASVVFHLAPPPREGPATPEIDALKATLPSTVAAFVYGSTTGAFGEHAGHPWIDEDTPTGRLGARGDKRWRYEQALAGFVDGLKVVRIAGIYGPGRTLWAALQRPGFVLFEGGPPTSRTHVDDLAALLEAMGTPDAPRLAIACDDLPAPTLEVARFTCDLMSVPCPTPLTLQEAKQKLSPTALELRMGGRRCRSKVRPSLVGTLRYPTYETGIVASLRAEGLIAAEA